MVRVAQQQGLRGRKELLVVLVDTAAVFASGGSEDALEHVANSREARDKSSTDRDETSISIFAF